MTIKNEQNEQKIKKIHPVISINSTQTIAIDFYHLLESTIFAKSYMQHLKKQYKSQIIQVAFNYLKATFIQTKYK
jgi:hypothetical protein